MAFVYFRTGVLLIDRDGVLLEPAAAGAVLVSRCLSGVREEETEEQRADARALPCSRAGGPGTSLKDISEVNAADPSNLRVVAQGRRPGGGIDSGRRKLRLAATGIF